MIDSYIVKLVNDLSENDMIVDHIFAVCAWVVLIIAGIVLYVFLVTSFLPQLLLTPTRKATGIRDRGIKKYTFPEGRGVVYEPELRYRQYVSKYLLFEYRGRKYIKLKLNEGVLTAECELAFYNNRNKLVKIMSVMFEDQGGESEAIMIPDETSYAGMTLIAVNGKRVTSSQTADISVKRWAIFAGITSALTVIVGFMIRYTAVFLGEVMFKYSRYGKPEGVLIVFIVSLVIGALISVIGAKQYSLKKRGK